MDQHSYENHDVTETHDIIHQCEDEEGLTIDSIGLEDTVNNIPDDELYSNDCATDDDDEIFHQASSDIINSVTKPSSSDVKQISIALALFRHRHNLSKSCVNDLCDLLRSLGVANVPCDFRAIERNVTKDYESVLKGKTYFICSLCGNKSTTSSKCENVECESSTNFKETPTTLCSFKLLPQVTSILERHKLLPEKNDDNPTITDVRDADMRRKIVSQERMLDPKKQIITFLLNSDGIVVKKFSRSLWITCMVINELPRAIRFNTNNIIICSISAGPSKPKKDHFQSFIADWIHELRQLELGFYISFPDSDGDFVKVHAYLIAAGLDKPAQALLLNINDPVGFYSCVRCTIQGKLIYIRSHTNNNLTDLVHCKFRVIWSYQKS